MDSQASYGWCQRWHSDGSHSLAGRRGTRVRPSRPLGPTPRCATATERSGDLACGTGTCGPGPRRQPRPTLQVRPPPLRPRWEPSACSTRAVAISVDAATSSAALSLRDAWRSTITLAPGAATQPGARAAKTRLRKVRPRTGGSMTMTTDLMRHRLLVTVPPASGSLSAS